MTLQTFLRVDQPKGCAATSGCSPGSQHPHSTSTLTQDSRLCVQGLPAVVAILQVPAYQTALLEGLAASVGGLDSSLSKAASTAVLRLIEQQPASGEGQGR